MSFPKVVHSTMQTPHIIIKGWNWKEHHHGDILPCDRAGEGHVVWAMVKIQPYYQPQPHDYWLPPQEREEVQHPQHLQEAWRRWGGSHWWRGGGRSQGLQDRLES